MRHASFFLLLAALAAAPATRATEAGALMAVDRGCYNCHGVVPHHDVPAFSQLVQKWSRFGGKPDDGAVRHAVDEMREVNVLVHQVISREDAGLVVRWLMEGAKP